MFVLLVIGVGFVGVVLFDWILTCCCGMLCCFTLGWCFVSDKLSLYLVVFGGLMIWCWLYFGFPVCVYADFEFVLPFVYELSQVGLIVYCGYVLSFCWVI